MSTLRGCISYACSSVFGPLFCAFFDGSLVTYTVLEMMGTNEYGLRPFPRGRAILWARDGQPPTTPSVEVNRCLFCRGPRDEEGGDLFGEIGISRRNKG